MKSLLAGVLLASSGALAANCYIFETIVDSQVRGVFGDTTQSQSHLLVWRDQGAREHGSEALLTLPAASENEPPGYDQPGNAQLMTNSLFASDAQLSQAAADLGAVRIGADGSFRFDLDPNAQMSVPINLFVMRLPGKPDDSGPSFIRLPATHGAMLFQVQEDNSVIGIIDLFAMNPRTGEVVARYQARLQGTFQDVLAC